MTREQAQAVQTSREHVPRGGRDEWAAFGMFCQSCGGAWPCTPRLKAERIAPSEVLVPPSAMWGWRSVAVVAAAAALGSGAVFVSNLDVTAAIVMLSAFPVAVYALLVAAGWLGR
jgi:hypothetical protein